MPGASLPARSGVAHCSLEPDRDDWVYWQYHNLGRVDGINGDVDLNVLKGGRANAGRVVCRARTGLAASAAIALNGSGKHSLFGTRSLTQAWPQVWKEPKRPSLQP